MMSPQLTLPLTNAVRRALAAVRDERVAMDLLFLEAWELRPSPGTAAALRIGQMRRANPELAAELRAEIASRRPLVADAH
jgi:CRISPR/Cas system-associated protein Csm6